MTQTYTVSIAPAFYILCNMFSCSPEEVLQYYLNHISLTQFMRRSLDTPTGAATYFFIQYSDSGGTNGDPDPPPA